MKTTIRALKRAAQAARKAMGPQRYGPHGKPIVCPICGHDRFTILPGIITMFSLTCSECGHLELFQKKPEWIEP